MAEPLLRISHLTKKFGDATVVDDRPERRRQDDDDPRLPRPLGP